MRIKRTGALWALFSLMPALVTLGCASGDVVLPSLKVESRGGELATHCQVAFVSIVDERRDKETPSQWAGNKVITDNASGWLKDGLSLLEKRGYAVFHGDPADASALKISLSLHQLYIFSLANSKSSNLVVSITILHPEGARERKILRATDTSVNWFASDSEAASSFGRALDKLVESVDGHLRPYCASQKKRL